MEGDSFGSIACEEEARERETEGWERQGLQPFESGHEPLLSNGGFWSLGF
jgi:hypothetical protein